MTRQIGAPIVSVVGDLSGTDTYSRDMWLPLSSGLRLSFYEYFGRYVEAVNPMLVVVYLESGRERYGRHQLPPFVRLYHSPYSTPPSVRPWITTTLREGLVSASYRKGYILSLRFRWIRGLVEPGREGLSRLAVACVVLILGLGRLLLPRCKPGLDI